MKRRNREKKWGWGNKERETGEEVERKEKGKKSRDRVWLEST